ncbi:MAG TPA: sigma-70 family RNA polymerase sigma factor [Thermoanaerobaculia bacterium]|jgi:RNA polymerase sigma-70 factor (ECF subfamily)|nr:sigma-70 family RNA polymerase sigma factor [Thermoanaerobaculia bacterium]
MPGDHTAAFEALFEYYPAVVSLLRKMGFDHEDARDLAQQVFLRVYQHMDAYRGDAKWHYLEQVTRRLAYNDQRDRHAAKREGIRVATEEIIELPDERTPAADAALESEETSQRVWRAINQLTPSDQTAIRLQMADLSQEAIAGKLGITVSALKSRLSVARKRLRVLLGDEPEGLDGRE